MKKLSAAMLHQQVCSFSVVLECSTQCPTSRQRQSAPWNRLNIDSEMSRTDPSDGRCIYLKNRVAIFRPKWKVVVFRNLTACNAMHGHWDHVGTVVLGWSRMKHRCTMTQQWVAFFRPQWKVVVYRNLTSCQCMGTVTAWCAAERAGP